jgi:hypothetical protein
MTAWMSDAVWPKSAPDHYRGRWGVSVLGHRQCPSRRDSHAKTELDVPLPRSEDAPLRMRLIATDLLAESTLPPVRESALMSVVKYRPGCHAIFSTEHRNLGFFKQYIGGQDRASACVCLIIHETTPPRVEPKGVSRDPVDPGRIACSNDGGGRADSLDFKPGGDLGCPGPGCRPLPQQGETARRPGASAGPSSTPTWTCCS